MRQNRPNGRQNQTRVRTFTINEFGPVSIAWNEKSISRIRLGKPPRTRKSGCCPSFVVELERRLKAYFEKGRAIDLNGLPLDMTAFSPFQKSVWKATSRVPLGQTRSYSWIASRIGRPGASRAVGNALGRNLFSVVIPCHRIVAAGGRLGGYGGGLEMKRRLLAHERNSSL